MLTDAERYIKRSSWYVKRKKCCSWGTYNFLHQSKTDTNKTSTLQVFRPLVNVYLTFHKFVTQNCKVVNRASVQKGVPRNNEINPRLLLWSIINILLLISYFTTVLYTWCKGTAWLNAMGFEYYIFCYEKRHKYYVVCDTHNSFLFFEKFLRKMLKEANFLDIDSRVSYFITIPETNITWCNLLFIHSRNFSLFLQIVVEDIQKNSWLQK